MHPPTMHLVSPSLSQIKCCERSFSLLKQLHPWLRCTIRQDRLYYLGAFAAETEEP